MRQTGPTTPVVPSSQPDLRLLRRLALAQQIALILVTIVSLTILGGWWTSALQALLPSGWMLMKANTALALLLGATGLALSQAGRGAASHRASTVLAIVILALASIALYEHLSGRVTGLNTLVAQDPTAARPGLMSLQTATYLIMMGLSLLFIRLRKHLGAPVVDVLTTGLVLLVLVMLAGYCFGASDLFGQSQLLRTSPHTLFCMALLAFVVIGRRTENGYFSVLVGVGIGSRIARITLPVTLVLPFVLAFGGAYARLAGWLPGPNTEALTASITAFLFFCVVIVMAWRINDLERDLRDMSLTDELTNTYNLRGFQMLGVQAMRETQRANAALTVLFFDLDGLKRTNDRLGHEAGSAFIADIARVLRTNFRGADIVARVGGDEFAVVAHSTSAQTDTALTRVNQAVTTLNNQPGRLYTIAYSVGTASTAPPNRESFDALVARADGLMYENKRARKAQSAAKTH